MHWRDKIRSDVEAAGDQELLAFLDSNGLQLNRREVVRADNRRDYFLFIRLTESLRAFLGVTGDEVLAVVLHRVPQQAWFFSEARALLHRWDRLTKSLVFVFSADPNIEAVCQRGFRDAQTRYKTAFIGIAGPMLGAVARPDDHRRALSSAVQGQAFSVDHFDARTPVPDDMFGREALVSQIEHDAGTAAAGVAILGVRRAGKTSLLDRVTEQLQSSEERWIVGRYDAQNENIDADSGSAFQAFVRSLRKESRKRDIRLQPTAREPHEQLSWMVNSLVEDHDQRVLLAIDEVEWLVPTAVQVGAEQERKKDEDYIRLFGRLRALKHNHGSRVSLLVCGINETFCEREEYSDHPNPSLDLFRRHYAALLKQDELLEMLGVLGARMGVQLAPGFASRVVGAFGGHAYLARQFCSEASKGKPRPLELRDQDFNSEYGQFMTRRAPAVLGAVMSSLARFYPQEYEVLRSVARGEDPGAAAASAHLKSYGLLDDSGHVAFDALREYAASHTTEKVRAIRYERLGKLGEGTTGVVYKSFDRDLHRFCAVKHFLGRDADRVARAEWGMLSVIGSKAIPEPYELTEVDGNPAIVMELIEGTTLEDHIKQEVPGASEVAEIVGALLASVASVHPSTARKQELRAAFAENTSIDEEEYQSFLAALESGYLHRDLKPANIVLQRGEERGGPMMVRLLDVQLSKPIDDVGLTQVGTPAYLPPDVGVVPWNASFDLFAVGTIVHELVLGVRPVRDEVLRHVGRVGNEVLRRELEGFFGFVLASSSADRPGTTEQFIEAWESVITSAGWSDDELLALRGARAGEPEDGS